MATATYTKAGVKATTPVKLNKDVFGVEVKNHQLLKDAYLAYLANGRTNNAVTKTRGDVSGGGIKPWRQKGTGRARFGSSRNPIWRKGGIAFGPTGEENYSRKLNVSAKKQALRQALSLADKEGKLIVLEAFDAKDGKVKATATLLNKIGAKKNILLAVETKDQMITRATSNIPSLKTVAANYLNVYDILNADTVVITKESLTVMDKWLGDK